MKERAFQTQETLCAKAHWYDRVSNLGMARSARWPELEGE